MENTTGNCLGLHSKELNKKQDCSSGSQLVGNFRMRMIERKDKSITEVYIHLFRKLFATSDEKISIKTMFNSSVLDLPVVINDPKLSLVHYLKSYHNSGANI